MSSLGASSEAERNTNPRDTAAMPAPGELDLALMLAGLEVVRRPGTFVYIAAAPGTPSPPGAVAMLDEGDAMSYIVPMDSPVAVNPQFPAAWLTLTVHSSLDAVGLTAAVATALAAHSIPANVLAGYHHDHVLVPVDRADDAIAVLLGLAAPDSPES